ncbi:MAG: hypothetical protein GF364_07750 [Candidatus Lokiarchaeota archaeon]|nr:hypothetical protein [Candidatus Lokiarchaeota archaeon]
MITQDDKIYSLNEEDFSLILRCMLDRVPILITGINKDDVEFFAHKLADLMSFRNKIIFYTDFISKNELDMILDEEESNYDVQRSIIISPNDATHKALQIFNNFKSWILCFHYNDLPEVSDNSFNSRLNFITNLIQGKEDFFLLIENLDNNIDVNVIGKKVKFSDLKYEKLIHNRAIKFVDNAINRMKRIFSQRLLVNHEIEEDFRDELLNFGFEENNLKNNFFKIKILEFYNAARRAFSILNKISILSSLNINIELNYKTLMDTISYTDASHSRLLDFIRAEWNEGFSSEIDTQEEKYKSDLIEGLWG